MGVRLLDGFNRQNFYYTTLGIHRSYFYPLPNYNQRSPSSLYSALRKSRAFTCNRPDKERADCVYSRDRDQRGS